MPRWATPLIAATRSVRVRANPSRSSHSGFSTTAVYTAPLTAPTGNATHHVIMNPRATAPSEVVAALTGSVLDRPSAAATVKMSVTAIRLPIYVPSVPSRPATGPKNGCPTGGVAKRRYRSRAQSEPRPGPRARRTQTTRGRRSTTTNRQSRHRSRRQRTETMRRVQHLQPHSLHRRPVGLHREVVQVHIEYTHDGGIGGEGLIRASSPGELKVFGSDRTQDPSNRDEKSERRYGPLRRGDAPRGRAGV